ncbi:hypothetical protein FB451DRAFT_1560118 [Mycena latifolia]|nr:hypothetical protein FB451DRAFT_1560118 [Mycena latifolia]
MLPVIAPTLHVIPTAAMYLAALLFVFNAGSWPLVWHFRLFAPVIEARLAERLVWLRHLLSSRERRAAALEAFHESRMPVGVHPLRAVCTYTSWVSLDDSDFNLHMSNSSYAKALDAVRFRLSLATFPNIFPCGGWVPLAATHYHFIREIPMLSRYEVRTSIGAWDDKWIWVISRFVKPASKKSGSSSRTSPSDSNTPAKPLVATLKTPATPLLETPAVITPATDQDHDGVAPDEVSKALLARAAKESDGKEPDGAVLYTVCVSQMCFKVGRRTVPPAVVLAANGFYAGPSSASSTSTSTSSVPASAPPAPSRGTPIQTNETKPPPPPYWPATRPTRTSMRTLRAFYAGGWPEERWWEAAFVGCEDERRARLMPFAGPPEAGGKGGIKGGLEGVRGLA